MTAICATCVNLHPTAKTDAWFKWICAAAPRYGINPVTGFNYDPPFALCRSKNYGDCEDWVEGLNCFAPDQYVPPKR